jgi:glycosyltransferase involved in cell wall biosynthesis
VAESAARIVAVSEAVARWLAEEGLGARVDVVPNGVEPEEAGESADRARTALGLPEDGVMVGLVGQILPHKGALEFLRAGRMALEQEPGLRFFLAGPGPARFRRAVDDAIASAGCAGRFRRLPPAPDGARHIRACDVVCLATTTADPFPRAVLEAMAHGRPVAAFDSGGTREMVVHGETGLLVPPGDVAALAQAFVRLARDPALRERMGRAGVRRARESFSVRAHVDRMEAVLRKALR